MEFFNHPMIIFASILLIIGIEFFVSKKKGLQNFTGYEAFSSIAFMGFDKAVETLTNNDGHGLVNWLWDHRFFELGLSPIGNFAVTFVVVEFVYYLGHWYNHHVNLGWASHIMHHSPTKMNLTVGHRLGITRLFSLSWIGFPLIVLLGCAPVNVLLVAAIILYYQFFLHSEFFPKMGWLDKVINTPSAHRVHHSSNPIHYNKNLGGIFLVFDHMFGTFMLEGDRSEMKYGIPSIMEKKSMWHEITCHWKKIFRELRISKGFKKKVTILFGSSSQKYTPLN